MRLALGLVAGIFAAWWIPCGGLAAYAQPLPRTLEDIKVYKAPGGESLHFHFSRPYEGQPAEEHSPGTFSLNFSATGSRTPVRGFRVTDGQLIDELRVVQNKYSTTVSIELTDPKASMRGRLAFVREGNLLRVTLGTAGAEAPMAAAEQPPEQQNLLSQMTRTIAGEGSEPSLAPGTSSSRQAPGVAAQGTAAEPTALGQYEGANWLPAMGTLAISLIVIVGVLYLVVTLYNRFLASRLGRSGTNFPIRQIASFHIGPKQRIVVLDINGEVVACGVTASQISFLTRLGGNRGQPLRRAAAPKPPQPGAAPAEGAPSDATTEGGRVPDSGAPTGRPSSPGRAAAQAAAARAEPAEQNDPVQQFADALKEKVSSMKRIK